jgi:hypothetical protein
MWIRGIIQFLDKRLNKKHYQLISKFTKKEEEEKENAIMLFETIIKLWRIVNVIGWRIQNKKYYKRFVL